MMTRDLEHLHRGTPALAVADPRGLAVRAIQYHRRQTVDPVEARVTHQRFDAAGRPVASRDPYLFALAQDDLSVPANLSQVFSLSAVALSSDSVDAGWRVALHGAAGQRVEAWDGRGSHSLTEFDELLRPVAVHEDGEDFAKCVLERFTYAGVDADAASHNLCGQLIRHDDPAGTLHLRELGIAGALLQQTRHFLLETDPVNWPDNVVARDALLEPTDGATTALHYAASGELLRQIDALGNHQRFTYTNAAELKDTRLTLAGPGQTERTLVSDLQYNAFSQIESETAGNGVITRHHYDPADGRLIVLSAHKANGSPLQNLKYRYDAAGNVRTLQDTAQPIRYFNNQRIEPIKTYCYDTLNQLIEATGWEAKTGHGGPALPNLQPLPLDPNQIAQYTQTFHYDAGGNLLDLKHVGAQTHGRTLTRARYSNRCLPERNGRPPTEAELATGFDANGNLCELQAGQSMGWDLRNQLSTVRPVIREDGNDDYERYLYDGGGQRVRKLRANQANARTLISEVRYLHGVEIRRHGGTGEILHVINASAGSNSVQVLHWATNPPEDIGNDLVRYNLNDHLKSSALELDQTADLISQEWYYPFGGTACFAARSATEAKYKTVRYSGKERDATGLYYYGFRYYAPWLQRWINPDPAGYVDGENLYRMTKNNPITFLDDDGLITKEDRAERRQLERKLPIRARGMTAITKYNPELAEKIKNGLDDSRTTIANAIKAVESIVNNEDDGTYSGIISDYMGKAAPPELLLEKLKSLYALSRQYGHNSQRIVAVEITKPETGNSLPPYAFVYSHSTLKNIYINTTSLNDPREFFSTTLIHEYTHVLDELNTADFYYINDDSISATYNAQIMAFDWLEGRYTLTVKSTYEEDFIEASNEPDMQSALKKYANDRDFREFISTGNADSWSEMIASLSTRIVAAPQHIFV
ncbi:RHS repeat-associated core domain-containing protein [Pseudomonas sp. P5_109]|uniref:RHS repeat-associated core domain-containing protein n=1 Tax=Pseudomonas sp. P5_109 TaxID=3043441 RepID=UPI002A372026|nr:RHS repeat-associated core domain-containing protein [Pseudomonas sp. P5_109]WPN32942.1 RHS repeat-associated core domain-containing protein [Pseudomonas sp. P5_109]